MNKIKIEKPIFIVGAGHSGTSLLAKALSKHPTLITWHENNKVWIWGNVFKDSDLLTETDLTPKIKNHIENRFVKYLQKSGKNRICDKTPRNCLRIPFILAVFPDAKIIHIVRDGRSVINSTKNQLARKSYPLWKHLEVKLKGISILDWYVFLPQVFYVFKKVIGMPVKYWGVKPTGWNEWTEKYSLNLMLAKQWVETVTIASSEGKNVSKDNYLEVFYEDFINCPSETIVKIAKFADLENPESIIKFCEAEIDPSRSDKWRKTFDQNTLNELKEIIEPAMSRLGYKW
jgi:hypothetical protein